MPRVEGDVTILDQLPSLGATNHVRMVVHAAIDAEAPIHKDRLAKVVAGAFGLNRVSEERKRGIQRVVPSEYRREPMAIFIGRAEWIRRHGGSFGHPRQV